MRARQAEPSPVRPGEPDEYGTWTAERLEGWLRASTGREPVIVVSHRAPCRSSQAIDSRTRGPVELESSGIVSAVEPLIRACSGVWVAHGKEEDSTTDDQQPYRVRRVSLDDEEQHGSYYGFANEALWPMCHRAHVKPTFRPDDFTTYWNVNARFADVVRAGSHAAIHRWSSCRTTTSRWRRNSCASGCRTAGSSRSGTSRFRTGRRSRSARGASYLLEGLLGSSIIGFQTPLDCRNFIETVERCLGAHVDRYQDALTYGGRQVLVRAYPTSVRWPGWWASCSPTVEICRESIRRQLCLPADIAARRRRRSARSHQGSRREVSRYRAAARVLPGISRAFRVRAARGAEPRDAAGISRPARACARRARPRQRALRQCRLHADHPARGAPHPGARQSLPARRRFLLRRQPARRA